MKILVVGCAGFIGSNVIKSLKETHGVWGIDNLSFGYADAVTVNTWSKCGFETLTENYLKDFDVLIHLATANIIYAQTEPVKTFKTNAVDTLELFRKFKGKIIYTSTASVYGNSLELPTTETAPIQVSNAYDMSKYIAEQYLRERGNYTTLRLSNVYGPGQRPDHPYSGVIGKFIGAIVKGEPVEIYGDGSFTRDYTYISDVVDAISLAVDQPAKNTEINICGGVEYSINSVVQMLTSIIEGDAMIVHKEPRSIDGIKRRWLSRIKAFYQLGWQPKVSLENGILLTLDSL
jgi:UDP-glucose 4-epimerase